MTMENKRAYAEIGGRSWPIRHFDGDRLVIDDGAPMPAGAPLAFVIMFAKNEHALRIPVTGRAIEEDAGHPSAVTVAIDPSSRSSERLEAAVEWMTTSDPFPRGVVERFGGRDGAPPARRTRTARAIKTALLFFACLGLGSYVVQATAFSLNLQADSAYVAADTRTISAADSGSVVFLHSGEAIVAGEPLLGVETRTGSAKTLDAPFGGNVVAHHVEIGDLVRQGDPVVTVAAAAAVPYVIAYVAPADILKMGPRSRALVTLPGGRSLAAPVSTDGIFRRIDTADGKDLIGLKIDVAGLDPALIGRLVDVRFELGSLLQGLDLRL